MNSSWGKPTCTLVVLKIRRNLKLKIVLRQEDPQLLAPWFTYNSYLRESILVLMALIMDSLKALNFIPQSLSQSTLRPLPTPANLVSTILSISVAEALPVADDESSTTPTSTPSTDRTVIEPGPVHTASN